MQNLQIQTTAQLFEGDGRSSSFVLQRAPAREVHTLVFVDCVLQFPGSDYEVVGDVLVFPDTVPAMTRIDVRYGYYFTD